jgi:hypothetical protein
MATQHTTELHYLELLHTIASGERRAGVYLQAWADTTPDPELRACLSMVADRETSHYHIFKRRIAELGFAWTEIPDADFEERLQVSGSALPDVEKIRGFNDMDPPLFSTALKSQNGCGSGSNHSLQRSESNGTED